MYPDRHTMHICFTVLSLQCLVIFHSDKGQKQPSSKKCSSPSLWYVEHTVYMFASLLAMYYSVLNLHVVEVNK